MPTVKVQFSVEQIAALEGRAAAAGLNKQDVIRVALAEHLGLVVPFKPLRGSRPGFSRIKGTHGQEVAYPGLDEGGDDGLTGWYLRLRLSPPERLEVMAAEEQFQLPARRIVRRAIGEFLGADSAFHAGSRPDNDPLLARLHELRVGLARVGTNLNAVARHLHLVKKGLADREGITDHDVARLVDDVAELRDRVIDAMEPVINRPPPRLLRVLTHIREAWSLLGDMPSGPAALEVRRRLERALSEGSVNAKPQAPRKALHG